MTYIECIVEKIRKNIDNVAEIRKVIEKITFETLNHRQVKQLTDVICPSVCSNNDPEVMGIVNKLLKNYGNNVPFYENVDGKFASCPTCGVMVFCETCPHEIKKLSGCKTTGTAIDSFQAYVHDQRLLLAGHLLSRLMKRPSNKEIRTVADLVCPMKNKFTDQHSYLFLFKKFCIFLDRFNDSICPCCNIRKTHCCDENLWILTNSFHPHICFPKNIIPNTDTETTSDDDQQIASVKAI